jgi:hypothetical protein
MKVSRHSAVVILILWLPTAYGQKAPRNFPQKLIETTVCKILEDPSAHNNKLVKVRGLVQISPEYSILVSQECPEGIWFAMGDGSGLPGLVAIVNGRGSPGSKDSKGKIAPPSPIHLIRDSSYREFVRYLEISAKGQSCSEGPPPAFPPDCRTYRVTATFTGRIDSVSKEIHAAHLKRSSSKGPDFKGFGHMGMFDAQLVVQSIENVVAVDTSEPSYHGSK